MENTPCRLCLEMLTETDLVLLVDFEKNMLETLIPIVNVGISCDTRMCNKCTKMLQISYDFKALCLDNNERVKKLLILKEVFQVSNCRSCCLCGFGVFEELDDKYAINWKEMVEICIPELDIYSSDNVSACGKCIYHLKDTYKFVSKCLETEETIKRYFDSVIKDSEGKVKLYDILKTENDILTARNYENVSETEHLTQSPILESSTSNNAQETQRPDEVANVSHSVQSDEGLVENSAERGSSNSTLVGNCGTVTSNNEDGALIEAQLDPTLMECSANVEGVLEAEDSDAIRDAQLGAMLIESCTGSEVAPETERHALDKVSQGIQSDGCLDENSAEKRSSVDTPALNNEDTLGEPQPDATLMECCTNVEEVLGPEAQINPPICESSNGTEEVPEPERRDEIVSVSQSVQSYECLGESLADKGSSDGNCGTSVLNNGGGTLEETQLDPTLMECSTNVEDVLEPENTGEVREAQLGPTLSESATGTEEMPEPERQNKTADSQQGSSQQNPESSGETLEHSTGNSVPSETTVQRAQKAGPRNRKNKSPKRFQCDKCSYGAKYKAALVSHMMSHKDPSETIMYQCHNCGHATKRKGDLKAHMIIHRDSQELKMFKCAECPYESKRKCDLKQHAMIHLVPNFKCKLCPFTTTNEIYLNIYHMVLHKDKSEIKMFKCGHCPYETKIKYRLKRHVEQQHGDDVELFKCHWCDFETKYKTGLRQHMVVHQCPSELTLFQCYICGYKAKYKTAIKSHLYRHNNFRNPTYRCDGCEYETKCKRSLKLHKVVHLDPSEGTQYKCELCAYQSRRKRYLKLHMRTHLKAKRMGQIDNSSK